MAQPPLAEWIRRGQPAHTPPQRPPGAERKGRHKGRKHFSKPDCTDEGRRKRKGSWYATASRSSPYNSAGARLPTQRVGIACGDDLMVLWKQRHTHCQSADPAAVIVATVVQHSERKGSAKGKASVMAAAQVLVVEARAVQHVIGWSWRGPHTRGRGSTLCTLCVDATKHRHSVCTSLPAVKRRLPSHSHRDEIQGGYSRDKCSIHVQVQQHCGT
eukprot:351809-Chlamydomonas_euryale.AAC.3